MCAIYKLSKPQFTNWCIDFYKFSAAIISLPFIHMYVTVRATRKKQSFARIPFQALYRTCVHLLSKEFLLPRERPNMNIPWAMNLRKRKKETRKTRNKDRKKRSKSPIYSTVLCCTSYSIPSRLQSQVSECVPLSNVRSMKHMKQIPGISRVKANGLIVGTRANYLKRKVGKVFSGSFFWLAKRDSYLSYARVLPFHGCYCTCVTCEWSEHFQCARVPHTRALVLATSSYLTIVCKRERRIREEPSGDKKNKQNETERPSSIVSDRERLTWSPSQSPYLREEV